MAVGLSAKGVIGPAFAAVLAVSGCTQGEFLTWDPDSDAERALRAKSEALQTTVGEASVAGFTLGAVIGGILGGTEGAFQGAQIGRFFGAGAGTYVSDLQAQYATREEVLDAIARDVEATNTALEATIADMRNVLEERRAALQAAQTEAASLERERARSRRALVEMEGAITAAENRAAFFGEARTLVARDGPAPGIEPRLTELSSRLSTMRQVAETLAAAI